MISTRKTSQDLKANSNLPLRDRYLEASNVAQRDVSILGAGGSLPLL